MSEVRGQRGSTNCSSKVPGLLQSGLRWELVGEGGTVWKAELYPGNRTKYEKQSNRANYNDSILLQSEENF